MSARGIPALQGREDVNESGIYDPRDVVEVGPLTVAEDEARAPRPARGIPVGAALAAGVVVLALGAGAGRLSAPVHPASTPGPVATVTATVTDRAGATSVTTATVAVTSQETVTATPTTRDVATVTDRILVPGPVRTVVQRQPAFVVHVTATRTVVRVVRR